MLSKLLYKPPNNPPEAGAVPDAPALLVLAAPKLNPPNGLGASDISEVGFRASVVALYGSSLTQFFTMHFTEEWIVK